MPELFPDTLVLVLCMMIVAGAQVIYATVGFGAGMFSVALLALVLPDLAGAVATLLLLTMATELWVLLHAWRRARLGLLLGLLPTTAVGMWLGTELLAIGDTGGLKRVLGGVVLAAGVWFLHSERSESRREPHSPPTDGQEPNRPTRRSRGWTALPAGLGAGTLAGLFGTGGPPVIVFLKAHRLDKGSFRATLLWYFLLMSFLRITTYLRADLLTGQEVAAALWLLPASLVGTVIGMVLHHRLSERGFGTAVSVLLMLLGGLLMIGSGK